MGEEGKGCCLCCTACYVHHTHRCRRCNVQERKKLLHMSKRKKNCYVQERKKLPEKRLLIWLRIRAQGLFQGSKFEHLRATPTAEMHHPLLRAGRHYECASSVLFFLPPNPCRSPAAEKSFWAQSVTVVSLFDIRV